MVKLPADCGHMAAGFTMIGDSLRVVVYSRCPTPAVL
jgi:hypothetical protein